MPYKIRAEDTIFGTSLPTDGPGLSARIKLMLEPPLIGTIASRKTSTPMPPIQCVKLRHSSAQCDRASTSSKMLAPVVVKPEIVSNSALVNEGISLLNTNGRQPNTLRNIQLSAVATQPSLR